MKQHVPVFSIAQFAARVRYEPESGDFFWLPRAVEDFPSARAAKVWHSNFCGKAARSKVADGYRLIRLTINGCSDYAFGHNLAYALVKGRWPAGEIDHENRDRSDCRWSNLRESEIDENAQNKAKRGALTSSRFKGVSWHDECGAWAASVNCGKTRHYLGLYGTEEDAAAAYNTKAAELHGQYASLNDIPARTDLERRTWAVAGSGARGVYAQPKQPGKWQARMPGGRYLGLFASIEAASDAIAKASAASMKVN